jgi:hypothetical protein
VSTTSGRRQGVAATATGPDGGPRAPKEAFRALIAPVAAYIAQRPSPAARRATARRIADAVIKTGDDLAQGGPNRWEDA